MKKLLKKLPGIRRIIQERDRLYRLVHRYEQFGKPGHFYSPLPSVTEIEQEADRIYGNPTRTLPGIELNESNQLELYEKFQPFYAELPFPDTPSPDFRYYYQNIAYSYSDAIILYCMLRHLQPKTVIEIGSGFSSALMLDTDERFLNHSTDFIFIEPYPQRLLSLLRLDDKQKHKIIPKKLQHVEEIEFDVLMESDVLFVDSSHVVKVGSDVLDLFFRILPRLKSGVYIHFHDIFYPFEYPKEWIIDGKAWNEVYLLRAFLQYNDSFEIVFFNTFLEFFHPERFHADMPLCMKNPGGSIWLRKR